MLDSWNFFRNNFCKIILLPKINQAERVKQFSLKYLFNVCFKFSTKVDAIRLNSVVDHVIRSTQITFIQGRYILDEVVTLHKTDHKLHRKR
jgi:hypothetical protein